MFNKVMVANRGAVAARVLRALARLKIPSVAVYSDADAAAPYLALAGEAVRIGAGPARQSYLNQETILEAARRTGCDGLHPGYGFLAENASFAARSVEAGIRFIGPSPRWIAAMGNKAEARALAKKHGFPVARGSGILTADPLLTLKAAGQVGYPLMVKPAGGGGGIGMMPVRVEAELMTAIARASSLALRGFGNGEIYLEQLFENPRHVEIQIIADLHGHVAHFLERDCSMQRRNQKIIEESPAPEIPRTIVSQLADQVTEGLRQMGYDNIGTVELLLAPDGSFTFLEMNTRLQVEHGVTEAVWGVDLVALQIQTAAGHRLPELLSRKPAPTGHAIEARICAEDSHRFIPCPGKLETFRLPDRKGVRIETGYAEGNEVSPFYDSLLAKVIVHRPTRREALDGLILALEETTITGVSTNIPALLRILRSDEFREGRVHTGLLAGIISP
jgi:acetyl-CoA carboxylase biotin carboxylase subunit